MAIEASVFLRSFFGSANELSASPEEERKSSDPLLHELIEEVLVNGGGILPRVHDGSTVWYVLPSSSQDRIALLEDYRYSAGVKPLRLSVADPFDTIVSDFTRDLGFRFRVPTDARNAFRQTVEAVRRLHSLRPDSPPLEVSATRELLRQLELAIVVGEAQLSESLLVALDKGGHLNATNLAFLKVRRLVGLALWTDVLQVPEWRELLAIRRPPLVTDAMLTAVYECEIRSRESRSIDEVIEHFRTHVLPAHGSLFRSGAAMRTPQALSMLMLYAYCAEPADVVLRDEVLAKRSSLDSPGLLNEIASRFSPEPSPPPTPFEALERGRFDEAFQLAKATASSRQRTEVMLLAATELQTIAAANDAVNALNALSEDDKAAVLARRGVRHSWSQLQSLVGVGAEVPGSWDEWLGRLMDGSVADAVVLAERGVTEWPFDEFIEDLGRLQRLATLISSKRSIAADAAFRAALPHFLLGLNRVQSRHVVLLRPIYEALLLELMTAATVGRSDLEAIRDVLERLIDMGLARDEYGRHVDDIDEMWRRIGAPRWLDWALELIEFLVDQPQQDRERIGRLFVSVLSTARSSNQKSDTVQRQVLAALAETLGMADIMASLPAVSPTGIETELPNTVKYVGLYCVDERLGTRAAALIRNLFPTLRVETSHDTVGSDRLRAIARGADLLLVVFRVATHAASDYIKAQRPNSKPTIYVQGRGSSSIVRSLFDALRVI